ncbi:hypothetical protein EDB19DRAFT_1739526 [Suillus lakei]|nr:hypothetical protein EDB19DRAFT_1739526 [Suillus lakei]
MHLVLSLPLLLLTSWYCTVRRTFSHITALYHISSCAVVCFTSAFAPLAKVCCLQHRLYYLCILVRSCSRYFTIL